MEAPNVDCVQHLFVKKFTLSVAIHFKLIYTYFNRKGGSNLEVQISLAAARVNADMTQNDVAESLHVSNKTVVNWENGTSTPSFSTMKTLSDMYKIPIDNILLPTKST